jgi:hypothetical protein
VASAYGWVRRVLSMVKRAHNLLYSNTDLMCNYVNNYKNSVSCVCGEIEKLYESCH